MTQHSILHIGMKKNLGMFKKELEKMNIFHCDDSNKALDYIDYNDIKLVLVEDINISDNFIQKIRIRYPKGKLAVVGYTNSNCVDNALTLMKLGLDDFLHVKDIFLKIRLSKVLLDMEFIASSIEKSQLDYLTNMYNRMSFHDLASKLCSISEYENTNVCCAMIDIDHFKKINDTYGHLVGDEVIKSVSSLIRTHFRKNDLVGRYGGEEFIVLMHDISPNKAEELFEKLRIKIEDLHVKTNDLDLNITVSIGLYTGYSYDLMNLQSKADELLYKAKNSGRNRLVCH